MSRKPGFVTLPCGYQMVNPDDDTIIASLKLLPNVEGLNALQELTSQCNETRKKHAAHAPGACAEPIP